MSISQHSGSTWQRGKDLHVKHNGVWKNVVEGHVNNSLSWQRFHVAEETVILSADASAVEVASLFNGDEWSGPKTKRLIIPNGVTISGADTAPALQISSGWNNLLTIENHGIIQGVGGAANGGIGGDALENSIANEVILENHGTIRSGGGGGGLGGVGGGGSYGTAQNEGPIGHWGSATHAARYITSGSYNGYWRFQWNSHLPYSGNPYTYGGWTYTHTGGLIGITDDFQQYQIRRYRTVTTYTTGGAAGSGGLGEGANSAAINGLTGVPGGTNSGTGGAGGAGGLWGLSGADGATGANGNNGSGIAGSPGGLAGYAYKGQFNVTNSGTILGRV